MPSPVRQRLFFVLSAILANTGASAAEPGYKPLAITLQTRLEQSCPDAGYRDQYLALQALTATDTHVSPVALDFALRTVNLTGDTLSGKCMQALLANRVEGYRQLSDPARASGGVDDGEYVLMTAIAMLDQQLYAGQPVSPALQSEIQRLIRLVPASSGLSFVRLNIARNTFLSPYWVARLPPQAMLSHLDLLLDMTGDLPPADASQATIDWPSEQHAVRSLLQELKATAQERQMLYAPQGIAPDVREQWLRERIRHTESLLAAAGPDGRIVHGRETLTGKEAAYRLAQWQAALGDLAATRQRLPADSYNLSLGDCRADTHPDANIGRMLQRDPVWRETVVSRPCRERLAAAAQREALLPVNTMLARLEEGCPLLAEIYMYQQLGALKGRDLLEDWEVRHLPVANLESHSLPENKDCRAAVLANNLDSRRVLADTLPPDSAERREVLAYLALDRIETGLSVSADISTPSLEENLSAIRAYANRLLKQPENDSPALSYGLLLTQLLNTARWSNERFGSNDAFAARQPQPVTTSFSAEKIRIAAEVIHLGTLAAQRNDLRGDTDISTVRMNAWLRTAALTPRNSTLYRDALQEAERMRR